MRINLFALIGVLIIATITGCGSTLNDITDAVDAVQNDQATVSTTDQTETVTPDDQIITLDHEERDEPANPDVETDIEEIGWQYAYLSMIRDLLDGKTVVGAYIDSFYAEYMENEEWCPRFRLYDLNDDDIPELFLAIQSQGGINVYSYDENSNSVVDSGLTVGYHTSGYVPIYPLEGTKYFITGPAFSDDTILYALNNGVSEQLLEYGEPRRYASTSFDDEINEDEFCRLLADYLGVEFNTSLYESVSDRIKEDIADIDGYIPLTDLVEQYGASLDPDVDLSGIYSSESIGETDMEYEDYISVDLVKDQNGQYKSMCMISRGGGTAGYFDVLYTDGVMMINAEDSPITSFELEPYGSGYMVYTDDNYDSILLIRFGDSDGTWWDE